MTHFYGCDAPSNLSYGCLPLNDVKLKNICTGAYPREAKQRYADNYVKPGLSYTVFELNDLEGYYMIAHGYSDLTKCAEISLTSPRHVDCNGRDVYLKSSILRKESKPKAAFTAMFYVRGTLYVDKQIIEGGSRIMYTSLFVMIKYWPHVCKEIKIILKRPLLTLYGLMIRAALRPTIMRPLISLSPMENVNFSKINAFKASAWFVEEKKRAHREFSYNVGVQEQHFLFY
uniref:Uncharacterized protein n=1 Tax=Glossina austeni TaxID=7395 RepID=A0A1A9VTS8_GLOAU